MTTSNLLVMDPLPEPKSRRPSNITGNIALVPFNIAPAANVLDPATTRKENKNRPTETKRNEASRSTSS